MQEQVTNPPTRRATTPHWCAAIVFWLLAIACVAYRAFIPIEPVPTWGSRWSMHEIADPPQLAAIDRSRNTLVVISERGLGLAADRPFLAQWAVNKGEWYSGALWAAATVSYVLSSGEATQTRHLEPLFNERIRAVKEGRLGIASLLEPLYTQDLLIDNVLTLNRPDLPKWKVRIGDLDLDPAAIRAFIKANGKNGEWVGGYHRVSVVDLPSGDAAVLLVDEAGQARRSPTLRHHVFLSTVRRGRPVVLVADHFSIARSLTWASNGALAELRCLHGPTPGSPTGMAIWQWDPTLAGFVCGIAPWQAGLRPLRDLLPDLVFLLTPLPLLWWSWRTRVALAAGRPAPSGWPIAVVTCTLVFGWAWFGLAADILGPNGRPEALLLLPLLLLAVYTPHLGVAFLLGALMLLCLQQMRSAVRGQIANAEGAVRAEAAEE